MENTLLIAYTKDFLQGLYDISKISLLRDIIKEHDKRYRIENAPIIDDTQYDMLFSLLLDWEAISDDGIPTDSPSQRIGYAPLQGFEKVEHVVPMLSLDNTYSTNDIINWWASVSKSLLKDADIIDTDAIRFLVEPKLDGSSIEVVYRYGVLSQASTRGNGNIGEDITSHAMHINNLPHEIAIWKSYEAIHLRGEVVMSNSAFERINDENTRLGKAQFANARNAAAGTLRQLNPSLVYNRGLECYIFELLLGKELFDAKTDSEQLEVLRLAGVPIHSWLKTGCTIQEVIRLCEDSNVQQETQYGNIACDGLVIKIESIAYREILGSTQHHPKRAIAYKYPAQEVTAYLETIERQVGRTGIITPVAILTPVAVSGVIVQRATLHNLAFIRDRKLVSGVEIWIKRSGEVIPYVVGLVDTESGGKYETLLTCPSCHSDVFISDDLVRTQCLNPQCPAQQKERLKHYVSRDAANIDGLGGSTLELLYEHKIISTIDSLYLLDTPLKKQQCLAMVGIGEKKYGRICHSIENTKSLPLHTILYGIGVSGIGKKLAKTLVEGLIEWSSTYSTKKDIIGLMQEYFVSESIGDLYGIGSELKRAIALWINKEQSIQLLEKLNEYGVLGLGRSSRFIGSNNKAQQGFFNGKKVLITGVFSLARRKIIDQIQAQGGSIVSSVSKSINIVLVGEKPGSKFQKAVDMGITVLYENEFIAYLSIEEKPTQKNVHVNYGKNTQQESLFG